jgi:hypothetical protein
MRGIVKEAARIEIQCLETHLDACRYAAELPLDSSSMLMPWYRGRAASEGRARLGEASNKGAAGGVAKGSLKNKLAVCRLGRSDSIPNSQFLIRRDRGIGS